MNLNEKTYSDHPVSRCLTKREYFAAMALAGLLSREGELKINGETLPIDRAAIVLADSLIASLNKK